VEPNSLDDPLDRSLRRDRGRGTDRGRRPRSVRLAPERSPGPQARPAAWRLALPAALGLIMLAATLRITLAGAGGHTPIVPIQPRGTSWLGDLTGERLTYHVFLTSVVAFTIAYAGLLVLGRRLPTAAVVGLIGVIYLVVFAGPITVSTDVFSYIAYARMGVLHGLNPYVATPFAIRHDPSYRYVGSDWIFVPTAYGPIYTVLSYPFGLLGLLGAVWGMKALTLLACLAVDGLVWRCARLRGTDPKLALLLVGANPLVVIYSLASAQNDLIMLALMTLAVYLTLSAESREAQPRSSWRGAWGAATAVLAALIKAPAGAMVPYLLVARRRISPVLGVIGAVGVGLAVSFAAFGSQGINPLSGVNRDAGYVSVDSFATQIGHLLGKPGVYPVDHRILEVLLVLVAVYLLWRTWRGYDWIAASAWTLLAVSVAATWVQAWYLLWPLPLAVTARDRRVLWGTLFIQGLFLVHQLPPLFVAQ
jgi:hypothetical protein